MLITAGEGQIITGGQPLKVKREVGPQGERIARVFTDAGELVGSYPVNEGEPIWEIVRPLDLEMAEDFGETAAASRSDAGALSDNDEAAQAKDDLAGVVASAGDAAPLSINVSLTDDALAAVSDMAEHRGKTVAEVLRQAIGHEKWLFEETRAGNRIVVRTRRGRDERELVFEP
jgi:hypothetical protein